MFRYRYVSPEASARRIKPQNGTIRKNSVLYWTIKVLRVHLEVCDARLKRLEIWGGIAWIILCALFGFTLSLII